MRKYNTPAKKWIIVVFVLVELGFLLLIGGSELRFLFGR